MTIRLLANPVWRRWAWLVGLALGVLALDQITKTWVTTTLALGESWAPIPTFANFFQITRSANSGAAFSIFQGANTPLLLLSLVMIGVIVGWYRSVPAGRTLHETALGILLGGVLGNALDRLRFGTVVDFIHWQLPGVISNVSNLADHAIVLSVLLLLIANQRAPQTHPVPNDPPDLLKN